MPNPVWQTPPRSLVVVTIAASLAGLHSPAFSQQAPSSAPQSFVVAEDGARLYYHVIGTGTPVVIAPAGFFFERDLAALGREHTVVFYDMRDRGRSEPVGDSTRISIANDVADLEAVRRHIGAERFVALGWSYLGQVVMRYAAAHPDHLERIVLIGPLSRRFGTRYPDSLSAHDSVPVPDPTRLAQLAESRQQGLDLRDPRADCEMDYAVNRAQLVGHPQFAGMVPDLCDMPNEWIAHYRQHNRFLFTTIIQDEAPDWDRFATLSTPVLVIHGTQDRNVPYGSGREWTAHLPAARLLTIRGAAHMPWLDAPDVVIPAIDSFLKGAWPSGAARVALEPGVAALKPVRPAPAAPLSTTRPADGTWVFNIRRKAAGDSISREFGSMTVTQARIDSAGETLLRRVIVYDYGARGRVVDTTLSISATLAPISERTYKPSGVIHLDFGGTLVTGMMGPVAAPKPIHDTLSVAAFNSTDLDFVVRSLALRDGLETQLAIYDPELGGFRQVPVNVEGTEEVPTPGGMRPAWRVRVRDRRVELVYRVDRETRALLGDHVSVPEQGVEYDIVPAEPGQVIPPLSLTGERKC